MIRRLVIAFLMLLPSVSCSAQIAAWTCRPVWNFSGMGDKTYEGASGTESAAKDVARKACVLDNRGIELDDFCIAPPKSDDWHCAQKS